jgi:hypothetical protein
VQVAAHTDDFIAAEGFAVEEVVDDVVIADGVAVHRAGITARGPAGTFATGAAADLSRSPLARARFELLERITLATPRVAEVLPRSPAPTRWQPARSNGVALAHDWTAACERAFLELAERDRVLRSWYGETRPEPLAVSDAALPPTRSYDWRLVRLSHAPVWSLHVHVVAAFALPRDPSLPLLRGFAGARDEATAITRAIAECVQGLAFLWGEPNPTVAPECAPGPLYHLDFYLWPESHRIVRDWLDGDGRHLHRASAARRTHADPTVSFTDLTPESAAGRFRVARACCEGALPLVFGEAPAPFGSDVSLRPSPVHAAPHPIP